MTPASGAWQDQLSRVRHLQTELMRKSPWRDAGLAPSPSAQAEQIAMVESRLGIALPPSYRAFLKQSDGWLRFYEGAHLLSAQELGDPRHLTLAAQIWDTCRSPGTAQPLTQLGSSPIRLFRQRFELLPFGIDGAGTTLFAFDLTQQAQDGEYEVVAWLNEVGVRQKNFGEFLRFVAELCDSELTQARGGYSPQRFVASSA